jgi:hypothetical protein
LFRSLGVSARPLRAESNIEVPTAALDGELIHALRAASLAGRLVRGLESAENKLGAEDRGLKLADQASGVERGVRVSRLLLLANDGADGFYKQVEKILRRHGQRVLAIRLHANASELGEALFGAGRTARLLMLSHKETVASIILAMATQFEET